jgi:AcrR family transcriptional regulator
MEARIDGRSLRYQHRRGELLDAVGEYVLENGVANLSLRRVAEAVGISHVTLQHHFGTKDELVGEIVEHLLDRTLTPRGVYSDGVPDPGTDIATRWRALWALLTSPAGQRDIRLFVEVLAQSALDRSGHSVAIARSITHRVDLIAANMISLGCPEEEARASATVTLATLRGMVLDLLATGERERVDAAFEVMLANAEQRAAGWSSPERAAALVKQLGALPTGGPPANRGRFSRAESADAGGA